MHGSEIRVGGGIECAARTGRTYDLSVAINGEGDSSRPSRAYVLSGDTGKARAAYEDFLALRKDADPNIPTPIQAKIERANLGQDRTRKTTMNTI